MADKYIIRELSEYKDFLESEFATIDLDEMEEVLFGDMSTAVDEFLDEFPEYTEDYNIDLPVDNFESYDVI